MRTGLLTALENPSLNLNHRGCCVWVDATPAWKRKGRKLRSMLCIKSQSMLMVLSATVYIPSLIDYRTCTFCSRFDSSSKEIQGGLKNNENKGRTNHYHHRLCTIYQSAQTAFVPNCKLDTVGWKVPCTCTLQQPLHRLQVHVHEQNCHLDSKQE